MQGRAGLAVAAPFVAFIEHDALPGTGITADHFWTALAQILERFTPENIALLDERDRLQTRIDEWHESHPGAIDAPAYRAFLREIGYLVPEPAAFTVATQNVDPEVATMAGPQLVVPLLNGRFALNAANARWGSFYDALYGTDALPGRATPGGYDAKRGREVIARAKTFLDETVPLASGHHADVKKWAVENGALVPALADPTLFAGYRGDPSHPTAILFRHHGLGIELVIDATSAVGKDDPAGVADVILEAAITTIVDLEDSVAAIDAEDKVAGYTNWLGLMNGNLEETFEKGGRTMTRRLEADRSWKHPSTGETFTAPGRSLLFLRNVGIHMMTTMVQLPDGTPAPEGIIDAMVTALVGLRDVRGLGRYRNSRSGSIYIVKPKLHGPKEAHFSNALFDAVEDAIGLDRYTMKIGVMDEERRTSANLAACIDAVKNRIVFINTGFLDRTGDEIHTSMRAGAMIRKEAMKSTPWIKAYEDRNVRIGLSCGLSGRAQIGKGMWAMPDLMGAMLEQKIAHPRAGATTAWVPSPTAATLHALHYHAFDVFARQRELTAPPAATSLDELLTIPLHDGPAYSAAEIQEELDNNVQGVLGYVVRWIDQGIGCSKVPNIHDVGLMEDRATLRISSQHVANWLFNGVCSIGQVEETLRRMAAKVDAQNAGDPLYRPMAPNPDASLAFQAARALIVEGAAQPNGYTEPILHRFRAQVKAGGPTQVLL
jgi:malate synthase